MSDTNETRPEDSADDSAESTDNVDVAEDGEASGNDAEETGEATDASEDQPEKAVDADTDNTEDVDTTADEETSESGSEETGDVSDTNENQPEDSEDDSAESTDNVDIAEEGEASGNDTEETGEVVDTNETKPEDATDASAESTDNVDATETGEASESGSEETDETTDVSNNQSEEVADANADNADAEDTTANEETSEEGSEESGEVVDTNETKPEDATDASAESTDNVDATETGEASESGSEETDETTDVSNNQSEEVADANADNADAEDTTANEETSEDGSEESGEVVDTDESQPEDNADASAESTDNADTTEAGETSESGSEETSEATDASENQPEELQENAENASNYAGSDANQSTEVNDGTNSNGEDISDGDIPKPENAEKTAMFENVSYHQGQNDFGARGTCGPTSIANSLNRVTGTSDYTENVVLHNAMDNDLCSKSWNPNAMGGTTTDNVVSIIDNVKNPDSNIHTEVYEYDKALSVDELADKVDNPGTVAMVGVDSATLWDQRGDVASSGLFQHTEAPSDHWITVDSPTRDSDGNVTGFNIIDSGGGVDYVDRDKFEAMYQGDASHTVSDPTAIIISNQGEATNTYETTAGVERTSNYKGSAEVSDGNDPPEKSEIQIGVTNTECDINGDALSDEAKEINDKFRGDQFEARNSFEATFSDAERKDLVDKNAATTCALNENLDGSLDGSKYAGIDKSKLYEAREKVPEITPDTVMQKVIPSAQVENYLNGARNTIGGCCSKAADTAPFISCGEDAYKELRLDYNGNDHLEYNVRELEGNADAYVIRFTTDTDSSRFGVPNSAPPCTCTGFLGGENHLIPEYTYLKTDDKDFGFVPTDAAIYKIDSDGNEIMVGKWDGDKDRFYPVP